MEDYLPKLHAKIYPASDLFQLQTSKKTEGLFIIKEFKKRV